MKSRSQNATSLTLMPLRWQLMKLGLKDVSSGLSGANTAVNGISMGPLKGIRKPIARIVALIG